MSVKYAINSKEEALSYLNHPLLGSRLIEITETFLNIHDKSAYEVLGRPDDLKLKSSMTLFDSIQSENEIFSLVLEKFYQGKRCKSTLNAINDK